MYHSLLMSMTLPQILTISSLLGLKLLLDGDGDGVLDNDCDETGETLNDCFMERQGS